MTDFAQSIQPRTVLDEEPELEGIYGHYKITNFDRIEVQKYRFAVLFCAISFCSGLAQWLIVGPLWAWVWLIPMTISLGLALKWIHIYLRPLHQTLQIFWALGCLGLILMTISLGGENIIETLSTDPLWIIVIGPLFAALTGLGFKEFFCFRRPEAIGLTILIPISLIGHLFGILSGSIVMALIISSAILLLVLALRKFGMDAASDVGDKSVFEYLDKQQTLKAL